MSKEITKASILQQLQDKFGLREFEPEKFLFSEMVLPIYNVAPHMQEHWSEYFERSITSSGPSLFFTVPEDQKWFLRAYTPTFMGAGALTVAGIYIIRRKREPSGSFSYLDLKAAQSTSYHVTLPGPVTLESRDSIYVNFDGYTATQDFRLYIDYMKEVIR